MSAGDRIRGRTIAITGAARGIGAATAAALLQRGARVVIGDRDPVALATALRELGPGPVSGYDLDVTEPRSFAAFLDQARGEGGGHLEVLINNAGVMPVGPFVDQSPQSIRAALEVNIAGVITGCRLVAPEMVARGGGHIVNIASMAGLVAVPGQAVYAATKFAVVGLSTALSDELAPHGVHVSTVLPTFTRTELIAGTTPGAAQGLVTPEAVARAVVTVLDTRRAQLAVPRHLRPLGRAIALAGPRTRRFVNRRMGSDRTFLEFDTQARQAYETRARASASGRSPDGEVQ